MIVLAHGTFDFLHIGHVRMFQRASELGELIVSLTADKYVNKGPGRPVFNQNERAEMIRAIRCVSEVDICNAKTGIPMIEKYRPAFYVKGGDYKTLDKHGYLSAEKVLVEALGGKLVLIEDQQYSSTAIIERLK